MLDIMSNNRMTKIVDVFLQNQTMNSLDLQIEDFKILCSKAPSTVQLLENSMEETEHLKKIESLEIPQDTKMITFTSNFSKLDQKQLQKKTDEKLNSFLRRLGQKFGFYEETKEETLVTAKIIDLGCFFQENSKFPDFCQILTE